MKKSQEEYKKAMAQRLKNIERAGEEALRKSESARENFFAAAELMRKRGR